MVAAGAMLTANMRKHEGETSGLICSDGRKMHYTYGSGGMIKCIN